MKPASGTEQTSSRVTREAGRAEEQRWQSSRGARGRAARTGVPPAPTGCQASSVAGPQLGGVGRGGQQGAARERAAAEQAAAGDEGDEQQDQEEHRAGLAGDALEARELLDLQEVGVVAAGAGLDGAAVPAGSGGGLGVGGADEVAGDLLDGGPHGRAGRREQRRAVRPCRPAALPRLRRPARIRSGRSRVPSRPRISSRACPGTLPTRLARVRSRVPRTSRSRIQGSSAVGC